MQVLKIRKFKVTTKPVPEKDVLEVNFKKENKKKGGIRKQKNKRKQKKYSMAIQIYLKDKGGGQKTVRIIR